MNRREFCFSLGAAVGSGVAVFGGHVVSAPVVGGTFALSADEHSFRFRAKKVFLDSWNTEILRDHASNVRRDRCDALVVVPGRCSCSRWIKQIVSEANGLRLTVLVPTQTTCDFFREAQTVIPLANDGNTLLNASGNAANDGGFLLVNKVESVFGLVLYDASRCLWSSYASSDVAHVQDARWCYQDTQIVAARWIDMMRLSLGLAKNQVVHKYQSQVSSQGE